MKCPKIQGKKIYLRNLELIDVEGNYPKWFDDAEVCKYNSHEPFTKSKQDFIDYVNKVNNSKNEYVFAICDKNNNKHIGNISIQKIDFKNKNAEIAIILGEKDYWGKGIGKEAWKLAIDFGFNALKLHRIYCGTHADNIGMQKIALYCGMKEEGRFKDSMFKNGKYSDTIHYGIINNKTKK